MHDLRLFPVRPKPQVGESIAGFFSRYFGANGHQTSKVLLKAVQTVCQPNNPSRRLEAWALINSILEVSAAEHQRFWNEDRFKMIHAQIETLKRPQPRIATREFRISPECLQSTSVHLAFWDLPLVFACPVHKRLLVTRCQCGRALSWTNVVLSWICSCGQHLPSLTAHPAHRSLIGGAKAIAAATDLPVPGLADQDIYRYRLGNDLQSTYDVLIWLKTLFRNLREPPSVKSPASAAVHWRFGSALDDWPNGLINMLRCFLKRWHQGEKSRPLVLCEKHSRAQRLLRILDEAAADPTLPSELRLKVAELPSSLRISSRTLNHWIFNPAWSVAKREERLNALMTWWHSLSGWSEILDGSMPLHPLRLGAFNQAICVGLLNRLVEVAVKPNEALKFQSFATAWPAMPADANNMSAIRFFELFTQRLLTVSSSRRDYLISSFYAVVGEVDVRR